MMQDDTYDIFKLGDWELQSGEKIIDAHIAYKTFGDPKSPAIVYPTWFSGGTAYENTDNSPLHGHMLTKISLQQSRTISG